jgi:hypothetical protein
VTEIVQLPPVADAGLNQSVPIGPIMLKGTGSDPDGTVVLYEWDFDGDDVFDWESSESGIVNHIFTEEGVFNAKLRVTDDSGLSALDYVTITVNNTYVASNVNAQIYIDWNSTYAYIISLNNSVDVSQLKVIVSDIIADDEEIFDSSNLNKINDTNYALISNMIPEPGHTIQVQVLYYNILIGARNLDVVNISMEFSGPDLDFLAVYDFEYDLTENDDNEIEIMRINTIGEYEIEQKGGLIYSSLHGSGVYYIYDEFEDGEMEITLNATDMWINVTNSGATVISQSTSVLGYGKMVANYDNEITMDVDIKKMKLVTENDIELESYMYGEGTFSGSSLDQDSGLEIGIFGNVYVLSVLLGHGKQINYLGDEYDCSIMYTNTTMIGEAGPKDSMITTTIVGVIDNTTWDVDFQKYTNNTIYYEYSSYSAFANLEEYDSGSGFPENSPTRKKKTIHIGDVMTFDTARPQVMYGMDSIVLESEYGVKLYLYVTGDSVYTIDGNEFDCSHLEGHIFDGGRGDVSLKIIRAGTFSGLSVSVVKNLYWKEEEYITRETIKNLQTL